MSPDRLPDPLAALLASPPDLPVVAALDRLRAVLADAPGPVVVTAPPGTGKTTLVPPLVAVSLADRNPATGRVIVTQPRRLATRAAARRLAGLLGQEVGQDVGYAVRGEHVSRPTTRKIGRAHV